MKTRLLSSLVKVAPVAMASFSILLMAHGLHVHAWGDPGGAGGPNLHWVTGGDPGGAGGPNLHMLNLGDPGGAGGPN